MYIPRYLALRQKLKESSFLNPDYADNTKIHIAGILRKWKKYCETVKLKACWRKAIEEADRAMSMDFLLHLCETYKIQSWGTSWEYFRQYKQLYASVTGKLIDRNDSNEVKKVHLASAAAAGVAADRAQPAEVVDNEKVKQTRCLGELFEPEAEGNDSRLFKELSQETVARGRPKALCYEDILLMVVRHPVLATGRQAGISQAN
ncbi:hypothetical protein V8E54_000691 [Elaphomyces granulatus]